MKVERWQQIDQLFHSALEREPDQRAAFLGQACGGDEALRGEVESLLAAHEQEGSFFETVSVKVASEMLAQEKARRMAGRTLGHYELLSLLGAGGMGEVYLAQDTRLKRRVALKLLPAEFTSDPNRVRRFEREAQAASALNHPGIVTIYEIAETDGAHFIAMELIEGRTLRESLSDGAPSLPTALSIAVQAASALEAAHESGIVHRDIKPENIMLRKDGYVKVLDFGIAKLTDQRAGAGSQSLTLPQVETAPGLVLGTVTYMSPEQARDLEVDARSDIFSLGVVIYEMITGHHPFGGATRADALVSILEKEPAPLAQYLPSAPSHLQQIISKALCKEREERYQSIRELVSDLKSLEEGLESETKFETKTTSDSNEQERVEITIEAETPTAEGTAQRTSNGGSIITIEHPRRTATFLALVAALIAAAIVMYFSIIANGAIDSIAVLPFIIESSDPNSDYLAEGLTDGLINRLSQLSNLKVRSLNSVSRYKGQAIDAQVVGRELKVRAVLIGRGRQQGENLSISLEMENVRDRSRIWGQQYQRKFGDTLSLPEEMAREVSEKLRLQPTGEEQQRLTKRHTNNVEAQLFYDRGRYHWRMRTEEGINKAIECFEQAIKLDPNFALAYAGLADAHIVLDGGGLTPRQALERAREAATGALRLDGALAEAHASLAAVQMLYDWDWPAAEESFKRALELRPSYETAHQWYAEYLTAMGRHEEAIKEIKLAQELDPYSLIISRDVGWHYYCASWYDQAIEQCQNTLKMNPNFIDARILLGLAYAKKEMFVEAIEELQKVEDLSPSGNNKARLGYAYALYGRREKAQQILNALRHPPNGIYVSPFLIATIYAGLGDKEQAFTWLRKAYEERSEFLIYLKVLPTLDSLRSDPGFRDLERDVGLSD
ncbi:MAG: protein kinase [Acidobacteriota bacterium]